MAQTMEAAPTARLKTRYLEEIRPALIERFGYSTLDAGAARSRRSR